MMVAMNPQTWDATSPRSPGGYLFYDNSKPLPRSKVPRRRHVIGVPLTEICNAAYADPRQRQLFKNIIYVGALSALLDIDVPVFERLFAEQYKGRQAAARPNVEALHLGRDWVPRTCPCPIGLRVRAGRRSATASSSTATPPPRSAASTAARRWRGIRSRRRPRWPRPSKYCQKYRVDPKTGRAAASPSCRPRTNRLDRHGVGAGWNGARAFTATSGPGVSLMNEFIGLAYFAEIPVTIIDVQRGGPSTGMPTRTQQSDLLLRLRLARRHQARAAAAGGPARVLRFAAAAFDLADRLQTPVFVMTDLDIGMNQRLCARSPGTTRAAYDRGKVMTAAELEAGATSAATRTSTATASRRTRRHAPEQGRLLHARHPRNPMRSIPNAAGLRLATWSGCCESSTPHRARWCRSRCS